MLYRPPKVQLQSNTTQLSSIKLNLKNKIYSTYACINITLSNMVLVEYLTMFQAIKKTPNFVEI